jgi:hypothetical protein
MTKLTAQPLEPILATPSARPLGAKTPRDVEIPRRQDWPGFLLSAIQFGVLVLIIRSFEIESQRFGQLAAWAWGGFVINHFLPARVRLPFFVVVSLWCLYVAAGGTVAVAVLAGGMVILGVCHLPIAFALRVLIIVGLGIVLVCLRLGSITDRINVAAWAILASMFMLRITVYLYDLRHKNAQFSLFRGMAYFFMLPNVSFLFFPVVDYKTFCTSHFNDVPVRIYQVGVRWIFRGIIHLLLYRLINQLGTVAAMDVDTLAGVVQFMAVTLLTYLKISGQFHIIVGFLHMFGFNLPETHHLYLLSSSFTDLWRRMNIYWKDYLMKILFYPAYFRLKRFGPTTALAVSTILVFFATWFLHGYQYFWINGSFDYAWQGASWSEELGRLTTSLIRAFHFSWQDSVFWLLMAVLVLINTLYEAKKGRQRTLTKTRRTIGSEIGLALATIGTVSLLCTIWTLWYTRWYEFESLTSAARNASLNDIIMIVAGLAGLGVVAVLCDRFAARPGRIDKAPHMTRAQFFRSVATLGVPACLVLLIGYVNVPDSLDSTIAGDMLATVKEDQQLNPEEVEELHRGYYEELDVARRNDKLRFLRQSAPKRWWSCEEFQVDTGYFQVKELTPDYENENYYGKRVTINHWGMRDRPYQKEKPLGVYRIALFGSSNEFGRGIGDEEVFDNLVEDKLNAEAGNSSRRYEILNFAQPADSTFHYLIELERHGVQFSPDAVLVFVNVTEFKRTLSHLASVFRSGTDCPYELINGVYRDAGIEREMAMDLVMAKLKPFTEKVITYGYRRLTDFHKRTGVPVYLVYRPSPVSWSKRNAEDDVKNKERLFQFAKEAGLPVIDLSGAFACVKNPRKLIVTAYDDHLNGDGHRILADSLFNALHKPDGTLVLEGRQHSGPSIREKGS